jgi:hypothetical protein
MALNWAKLWVFTTAIKLASSAAPALGCNPMMQADTRVGRRNVPVFFMVLYDRMTNKNTDYEQKNRNYFLFSGRKCCTPHVLWPEDRLKDREFLSTGDTGQQDQHQQRAG